MFAQSNIKFIVLKHAQPSEPAIVLYMFTSSAYISVMVHCRITSGIVALKRPKGREARNAADYSS